MPEADQGLAIGFLKGKRIITDRSFKLTTLLTSTQSKTKGITVARKRQSFLSKCLSFAHNFPVSAPTQMLGLEESTSQGCYVHFVGTHNVVVSFNGSCLKYVSLYF